MRVKEGNVKRMFFIGYKSKRERSVLPLVEVIQFERGISRGWINPTR